MTSIQLGAHLDEKTALALAIALAGLNSAFAPTLEPAQTVGLGAWSTTPVFAIGEPINDYTPRGSPMAGAPAEAGSPNEAARSGARKEGAGKPAAAKGAASGDDLKQIAGIGPGLEKKLIS